MLAANSAQVEAEFERSTVRSLYGHRTVERGKCMKTRDPGRGGGYPATDWAHT